MASSAGAAHMVHLCSIWATPWEQYEICQCQSQALCAHPCIPASGVRRITITISLRSSIWSRTQAATEDEKRIKPKLFSFQRYWELQTRMKVPVCGPGVYGTASSQGAVWHCTGGSTACSQGAEKNRAGGENSEDVSPTLFWMMWIDSGLGWEPCQVQLELVLSWAAEWAWCSDRALWCPGRSCAPPCCLMPLGTLTLAAAFGIGHP